MATSGAYIDKGPSIDWSTDDNIYGRFKMWKQRWELLLTGPMATMSEEVKCKHLLYWSGERGMELFNSWDLSAEDQKKLVNYWEKFENYAKPHSNELLAVWELHNLRQGMLSLEDFITKLRILIKEANYPAEHYDRFLRDFLVLGINSDRVRKDCFKEGNTLTFSKAREMAKTDESAERQLQLMNASEVNNIASIRDKRYQNRRNQVRHNPRSGQQCRNCGRGSHSQDQCPAKNMTCHYCQKVGHFAKVCLAKLRNKNVHEVEAIADNIQQNQLQSPRVGEEQFVFLGPIVATPLAAQVHSVSCKEKALLEVSISLNNEGMQSHVVCKIDSGAETNILPMSIYQQLKHESHKLGKPTMKLTAYGGAELPNLGSCFVFVK
ncbi:Retrovirus-related Pol poly from transposon, partial [Paramuricea clavata]